MRRGRRTHLRFAALCCRLLATSFLFQFVLSSVRLIRCPTPHASPMPPASRIRSFLKISVIAPYIPAVGRPAGTCASLGSGGRVVRPVTLCLLPELPRLPSATPASYQRRDSNAPISNSWTPKSISDGRRCPSRFKDGAAPPASEGIVADSVH